MGVIRLNRLLPPPGYRRRYLALSAIDALGTGLFMPVSVLFLTRSVGLPPVEVGIGLTVAGVVALLLTPLAGALPDRYDARTVAAIGYVVCAVGYAAYTLVDSFLAFVLLASAIRVFEQVASSARIVVALTLAEGADRVGLMAYERSTRNVGYGLGGLLASLALLSDTRAAYIAVLLVNAATFMIATLILARMPPAPGQGRGETSGYRLVLRDRPYVVLAALTALIALYDTILSVGLPLWIVRRTTVSPAAVGLYFTLNTALVVALQVRLSAGAADVHGAARAYMRATAALVASCALFVAASGRGTVVASVLLTLALVALTFGELFGSAAQWGASISLLREELRGRYLAVFQTGISVQRALAPALVTFALVHGGDWGWLALAICFLAAGNGAHHVATRTAIRVAADCEPTAANEPIAETSA